MLIEYDVYAIYLQQILEFSGLRFTSLELVEKELFQQYNW